MKKNVILVAVCSLFLGAMSSGVLADLPYRHSPNEHNQTMTEVNNSGRSVFDDVSSHTSDGVAKIDSKDKEASNLNDEFYDCMSVLEDYDTGNQEFASSKEVSILNIADIDEIIKPKSSEELSDILIKVNDGEGNKTIFKNLLQEKRLSSNDACFIKINSSNSKLIDVLKGVTEMYGGIVFTGTGYVIIAIPYIPETLELLDKLGFKFVQDIPPVPEPVKDMVNKYSKQLSTIGKWVADLGKRLFKKGFQRSKDALKQNKEEEVNDDVVSNNEAVNVFSKVESEPNITDSRLKRSINVIKTSIKSWFKKSKNKPVLTEA